MYNLITKMGGYFFAILLLILSYNSSSAQCPTGFAAFNFQTQTEIDDFLVNYPSCDTAVNLVIDFDDTDPITNLDGLINIVHVKDALFIGSDSLTDVRGLDNIVTIESSFEIFESERMRVFDGLPNLKTVGLHFNLQFTYLDSITGFGSLEHIGGLMHITYNSNLEYIAPLGTVDSLDYLDISFNDNLKDIKFLSPLAFVDGPVKLIDNYQLSNLMGLEDLSCVEALTIENCDNLSDISQLSNLQKLGTNADSHLNIKRNGNLFQLDGLQNIDMTTVSNLTIACSQQLNACSLPNICAYLEDPANNATVIGNDIRCADRESILAECTIPMDEICNNGIDDDGDGLVDCDDPDIANDCCCLNLTVDISPANQITCEGEQVALTATVNQQMVTYQWFLDGVDLNISTPSIDATESGTYTVVVTDDCDNLAEAQTDLTLFPVPTLFPVGDLTICVGDTSFIEVESPNVDSVTWYYNGDLIPGETDLQLNVYQAGEYVAVAELGPCQEQVNVIVETIDCGCPPLTLSPIPPMCVSSAQLFLGDFLLDTHTGVWSSDPVGLEILGDNLVLDSSLPGTYTLTFTADNIPPGCADQVSTEFILSEAIITNESISLCAGESYTLNGEVYSMTGTYQQTIETSMGCDSIINLDLLILPNESRSDTFNICEGSSIEVEGQTYSQEGTFTTTAFDANGCEYALNITIIVSPSSSRSETITLCEGESTVVNGQTYSQEGDYSIIEIDMNGCESILNLTIEILENTMSRDTFQVCQGDTVTIDGLFYLLPGNYIIPITGGVGCDTVRRFTIIHDTPEVREEDYFIKAGESITIHGETYDAIGQYSMVLPSTNNCGTTLLINIREANAIIHYDMEGCYSRSLSNGNDYSEFVPSYPDPLSCADVVASMITRVQPDINTHSCTEGVDGSIGMCVSSEDDCDYDSSSDKSLRLTIDIRPMTTEEIVVTQISFWQQAPEVYSWIAGPSGLNNYPSLFGVIVTQDGVEVYREADISTTRAWSLHTLDLSQQPIIAKENTTLEIRILGYCTIGNGSSVSAFDVDELSVCAGCRSTVASRAIAGIIEFADGSYMEDVNVILSAPGSEETDFTNQVGLYAFQGLNREYYYSVQPEKDDDHLRGISTLDIVKIQRHILGIDPFTDPKQMVAADVNQDEKINGIDLVELRKLLLGIYTELPQSDSYRFVSEVSTLRGSIDPFAMEGSITIPPSTENLGGLDFQGIKVGDVNNSGSFAGQQVEQRAGGYQITTRTSELDSRRIDFLASEDVDLSGMQLILEVDGNFLDLIPGVLEISDADHAIEDSKMKISWNAEDVSISQNEILFSIIHEGTTADIKLTQEEEFRSEIYKSDLEEISVRLLQSDILSAQGLELSISPNPFVQEADILFNSVNGQKAIIQISGIDGRVVKTMEYETVDGLNKITMDSKEFQNSGVYNVQLFLDGSVTTEKFVLLR